MMSGRRDETVKRYQPSVLVMDVALVLVQRGVHTTLKADELPQAHQAAWTLLHLLGVQPDTSECPCLACGGAAFQLSALNLVAADEPTLTGRPSPEPGTGGEASGQDGDRQ